MKLGLQVDLGRGHIALDGDPALPPPKGHSPQFSAHICCDQTVAHLRNWHEVMQMARFVWNNLT